MASEVVVHVRVKDDGGRGFDGARQQAKVFGDDVAETIDKGYEKGFSGTKEKAKKASDSIADEAKRAAPKIGAGIGDSVGGGLLDGLAKIKPALSGLGIGVGAALAGGLAPQIAGTVTTAVTSGIAAAGIGAGIYLTIAQDPKLQSAGTLLGSKLMKGLELAAKTSFAKPVAESFNIVDAAATRVTGKIGQMFSNLSTQVVPFITDLVQGTERIIDSFVNVTAKSGPAIDALGDAWRMLTDGLADGFEIMADGSQEAGNSIRLVAGATADLIRHTASFLNLLNEISDNEWIVGPLLPLLKKHYNGVAEESEKAAAGTKNFAESNSAAARAARGHLDAMTELSDEMKAQADPVFGLMRAQDKLADAQKAAGAAAKKHGSNSKEAKEALRNLAEAAIDMQGAAGKLGGTLNNRLTPELRATLRAAGLTDKQIGQLEKQFIDARVQGGRFAKRYQASVGVTGVAAARRSLYSVKDIIDDIPRAVRISMQITGETNVSRAAATIRKNRAHGGIVGAAEGGIRGDWTWVGESGPELMQLPPGTHVRTNPDSQRMVNSQRGDGAAVVLVSAKPGAYQAFVNAILPFLQMEIRGRGGNVQTVLGS